MDDEISIKIGKIPRDLRVQIYKKGKEIIVEYVGDCSDEEALILTTVCWTFLKDLMKKENPDFFKHEDEKKRQYFT